MIDVSAFVKKTDGKPVAVFGLGRSGIAAIKALVKGSVKVAAWDDKEENRTDAHKAGAEITDLTKTDLSEYACLILAPGVPLYHPEPHPVVTHARDANIEIIGDIELFHRCDHGRKTIGITGTNGKSTTTDLIGYVLKEAGVKAAVGGNIGKAVMELTLPPKKGYVVLEISSYQMDLCPTFTPDISILLNITPDHIDRHGSMENYAAAKERIFSGTGTAVISIDDDYCRQIYERLKEKSARHIISVSLQKVPEGGVGIQEDHLIDDIEGNKVDIGDISRFKNLPGEHNRQNNCAAYAALRIAGCEKKAVFEAMQNYPGLPHRQYLVRVINGVAYVNDSKATNAEATSKALKCYRNIYWIVGGRAKEGGLDGLEPYMERVREAFVIGEAIEDFGDWLEKHNVKYHACKTLDVAVLDAHRVAQSARGEPGGAGTVLLSPACASWDQYKDFEERGDSFASLVNNLDGEAAA